MFSNQVISHDVVNMPRVSVIQNVQMRGKYYFLDDIKDVKLPKRMQNAIPFSELITCESVYDSS
mgnify:CR=1 FL=1|jgi:CRISPR-associated protein Csc1